MSVVCALCEDSNNHSTSMLATTKRDSDNWNSIRSYEKVWLWLMAFFASKCRGKEAQEWRIKFHKRLIHNSLLRVLSRHQVVFMKMMVAFSLRQQPTLKDIYPKDYRNMVMICVAHETSLLYFSLFWQKTVCFEVEIIYSFSHLIYRTRATITRSWLETAVEY